MKTFKTIIKDIVTNEITLKSILVLCYIIIAISIYNLLDLIFIF